MVLAAVAIGGVLMAGVVTMINNLNTATALLNSRIEAGELMTEIKHAGLLSPLCRLNLANGNRTLTSQYNSQLRINQMRLQVDEMFYPNPDGQALSNDAVIRLNQSLPFGTKVKSISLVGEKLVGPNTYAGFLEVRFRPEMRRELKVSIQVNSANVITGCNFAGDPNVPLAAAASADCQADATLYLPQAGNGSAIHHVCGHYGSAGSSGIGPTYLCFNGNWVTTSPGNCSNPTSSN